VTRARFPILTRSDLSCSRRGRSGLVAQEPARVGRRDLRLGPTKSHYPALYRDYLDDELDDEIRAKLERQIAACPTCPPLYTALVGVTSELGGLRDPDSVVAPDLAERITTAIRARRLPEDGAR
jgi:hypothetical protein